MSIPFKSDIELNKIVSNDLDLEVNGLRLNGSTGTEGQVLTSTGSGAPIWSTVSGGGGEGTSGTTTNSLTITLNGTSISFDGSVARTLTLYAPTGAGPNGYLLQSNPSGSQPTWRTVSDSSGPNALSSTSTAIPTVRDIYNGLPYINGSHSYTRSTYIYAPISVGISGQILQSDGSGAPIWVDASSIGGGGSGGTTGTTSASLTISLNGSSSSFNGSTARSYSFYAPTTAGTDGYLLQSNGSGEPSWRAVSDSSGPNALSSTSTAIPTVRDIYYGLPYINNSHSYTSNTKIYAPTTGGTNGYLLKANGSTSTPTWVNVKLYQHNIVIVSPTSNIGVTCTIVNNSSSAIDTEAELEQWLTTLKAFAYWSMLSSTGIYENYIVVGISNDNGLKAHYFNADNMNSIYTKTISSPTILDTVAEIDLL